MFIASGITLLGAIFPTPAGVEKASVADGVDDTAADCRPNRRTKERGLVLRYFENAASRVRVRFCSAVDIDEADVEGVENV